MDLRYFVINGVNGQYTKLELIGCGPTVDRQSGCAPARCLDIQYSFTHSEQFSVKSLIYPHGQVTDGWTVASRGPVVADMSNMDGYGGGRVRYTPLPWPSTRTYARPAPSMLTTPTSHIVYHLSASEMYTLPG